MRRKQTRKEKHMLVKKQRGIFVKYLSSVFVIGVVVFSMLFAQTGTIKGKVVESLTGKPVANVNIKVLGTHIGTTTNSEGNYFLPDLQERIISIEFSAIGYKTREIPNIKIESGQTKIVDVELVSSAIKCEEVVVTATRRPTLLKDVPEIAMTVSRNEIEITSPRDAGEAVRFLPGASVEAGTQGGLPTKENISIDGLPAQYNIILLDGTRVLSSHFHTGADINVIPPENIERIELVKGAASSQYGSDGIGGVLNIITKKGIDNAGLQFTAYHGSQNTSHFSLFSGGKISRTVLNNVFVG